MKNTNRSIANKKSKSGEHYMETMTAYQGPLPSPDLLQGFESTLPGSADRIIKMAEREQKDDKSGISELFFSK